jgi:hypothetical protein
LLRGALNEAGGKTEFGAEPLLEFEHFAAIGFVIVTGEVQHAVEDENLYLGEQVVADGGGLGASGLERDGDVAALGGGEERGKGKHVGGFVLAAELQVEALNFGVAGEQDVDLAGESGGALSLVGKARKGEAAEVFGFSSF